MSWSGQAPHVNLNPGSVSSCMKQHDAVLVGPQARPLDVDKDMRPVVEFLVSKKVPVGEIVKVCLVPGGRRGEGVPGLGGTRLHRFVLPSHRPSFACRLSQATHPC